MSIQTVLSAVNGFGNGVTTAFTTLLTVNYFIGQNTVRLLTFMLSNLKLATICLLKATHIALEDLSVFLVESGELFVCSMEYIFSLIDASLSWLFHCYLYTKSAIAFVGNGITTGCSQICNSVAIASQNFGHALNLFGSSVLLLISLIPKTCHFVYLSSIAFIADSYNYSTNAMTSAVQFISDAPFETFLGLTGAIVITISLFRLTQNLIRNNTITTAQLLRFSLHAFCFIYINIIKCIVLCIRGVIRMVKVTLTHLHVTRFHHAGDSDAEEETDNQGLIGTYDESDDNENERMTDKRRNYELLVRRRQERKTTSRKRVSGKGGVNDADVEEMLFEQVEREREDKLCVVCQDKEKCIMILPCRHLCICQDCQGPLQLQNNHCPICRRLVRQTIKAYL